MGASTSNMNPNANAAPPPEGASKPTSRGSGNSRKKNRRRLANELDRAARQRQERAADAYYHNPPKPEDIWICEFCEYERIFGEPPKALIREYELKDRRARQEEADRKRLLEKARAKGRKSKKSGKAATKGANVAQQHPEDPNAPPLHHGQGHSTQSEEEYDDDYAGDYLEDHSYRSHRPPNNAFSGGPTVQDSGGRGGGREGGIPASPKAPPGP